MQKPDLNRLDKRDLIKLVNKRNDGWQNLMSLLGTQYDRKTHFKYKFPGRLDNLTLNSLYRGEGFAKKVVDLPVHHMTREWFNIEGDTDGKFNDVYKEIKFKKHLKTHFRWDRLHGGSGMVFGLDDGGMFHEEVNYNRLKKIHFIKVYDRWSIKHNINYRDDDPNSPTFGELLYYDIIPTRGVQFVVHRSRVHILDGLEISNRERHANQEWGDSVLQAVYDYVKGLANMYSNVESIVEDFIQTILKIENLQQLVATGREDLIKKRMEILDLGRSLMNTMLIDDKEDYEKKASQTRGVEKIIQEFAIGLSAVSNIPITLLMGRSPAGMDATGDSDLTIFYDWISSLQEEKPLTCIDFTNNLIVNCSEYKVGSENPIVDFCPLWQPTEKEVVESHKAQAETDAMYIDRGVLSADEVRKSRFGGETYSYETVAEGELEPEDRDPLEEEEGQQPDKTPEGEEEEE